MITFEVVKEPYGWAVRRDDCMMMPCGSKDAAEHEAKRMVSALRNHGQLAQVLFVATPALA